MRMIEHEEVIDFIAHFRGSEHTFLHGCCLWFAYILCERFKCNPKTCVLHEPIEGHFLTRICGRLYDVRGDVTDRYAGHTLEALWRVNYEDSARYERLMRDCRDFIDPDTDKKPIEAR